MSAAITYLSRYPDVYAYPGALSTFGVPASTYLNVYSHVSTGGFLRGANVVVSGGTAVLLTTTQLQQFGTAIRMHLATGNTNTTVNGVQVQTSGAGVNITAGGNTVFLGNADAANLATLVLLYTVTGGPLQQTGGGPMNFYDLNA